MKQKLTVLVIIIVFAQCSNAQNVGIGTSTPDAKIDVVQTATASAAQVNHQGTLGNSLEIVTTNSANNSSVLYMRNSSNGIGIDIRMNNIATSNSGLYVEHSGSGDGIYINQTNNGRGLLTRIGSSTNTATGSVIANFGLGRSFEIFSFNTSSNAPLAYYQHFGQGTVFSGISSPVSLGAGTTITANYLAYLGGHNNRHHIGSFSQSYPAQGWGIGSYSLGGSIGCRGEGGDYGVVGICQCLVLK